MRLLCDHFKMIIFVLVLRRSSGSLYFVWIRHDSYFLSGWECLRIQNPYLRFVSFVVPVDSASGNSFRIISPAKVWIWRGNRMFFCKVDLVQADVVQCIIAVRVVYFRSSYPHAAIKHFGDQLSDDCLCCGSKTNNPAYQRYAGLFVLICGGLPTKKGLLSKTLSGGRWGSNPRPSEPQSDALTDWATSTILLLRLQR